MKIVILKEDKPARLPDTIFVTVNQQEALGIIRSLAGQLEKKDSNNPRLESYSQEGIYFTIAIKSDA